MSRVAKKPIVLPEGVKVVCSGQEVTVQGPKGQLQHKLHPAVLLTQEAGKLIFAVDPSAEERSGWMQAGTARAIINNIVQGVNSGCERKLKLVGVGYRAALEGKKLVLTLGLSHPVEFFVPEGIAIEVLGKQNDEIVVRGIDKHKVNQTAANIRRFRKPADYTGKGIRYDDERPILKEVKKK